MTNTVKKLAIVSLFTGLAFAIGATVIGSGSMFSAKAADFVGNHYTAREATFSQSGCCEYWIDCNTHEMFFTKPTGTITEAGEATVVVEPGDPRYVASIVPASTDSIPTSNEITNTVIIDETPKQDSTEDIHVEDGNGNNTGIIITDNKQDQEYTIVGYNGNENEGNNKIIVIPEGVEYINVNQHDYHYRYNPFDATDPNNKDSHLDEVETLVIPSTIHDIPHGTFIGMTSLKTVICRAGSINQGAFNNCPNLEFVYFGATVTKITGNPFQNANADNKKMKLGCEAASKPANWSDDWNVYSYWDPKGGVDGKGGRLWFDTTWNLAY